MVGKGRSVRSLEHKCVGARAAPTFCLVVRASYCNSSRRIVDAAQLVHPAVVQHAFDEFITKQREHAPAHEDRPRIAIPIYARSATTIVDSSCGIGGQLAGFLEMQPVVTQKEDRCGRFKQMTVAGASRHTYR